LYVGFQSKHNLLLPGCRLQHLFFFSFLPRVIDEITPKKSSANSYEFFMKRTPMKRRKKAAATAY
jgi:hypothetical protein